MELKQFLLIFKKTLPIILVFSLFGAFLTYLVSARLPSGFKKDQLFYLTPANSSQKEAYDFEGFYAQEKARNFTDSVVAIIESPDFTNELTPSGTLAVRKVAPQIIKITAVGRSPEDATILLSNSLNVFNQKILSLSGLDNAMQLKPIGNPQPTAQASFNKKLLALFGFAAGATFAIFVIGLKSYFKI